MKLIKWLPILYIFSCINMFIQTTPYNSLYFTGGSWIEFPRIDAMKMASTTNDFTLQFWVSGGEVSTNEAPALFSLVDSQENLKLALLRDTGGNNSITTIINDDYSQINGIDKLDWSDPDNFILISFIFSDTAPLKIYINDKKQTLSNAGSIIIGDANLMLGAIANLNYGVLENYWYGYVDEIRLWNTHLADSTIQFQSEHPDKFGKHYRYTVNDVEIETYLDSLIGLWRFNLSELSATIVDESGHGHNGTLYTFDSNYSIELSERGAQ